MGPMPMVYSYTASCIEKIVTARVISHNDRPTSLFLHQHVHADFKAGCISSFTCCAYAQIMYDVVTSLT